MVLPVACNRVLVQKYLAFARLAGPRRSCDTASLCSGAAAERLHLGTRFAKKPCEEQLVICSNHIVSGPLCIVGRLRAWQFEEFLFVDMHLDLVRWRGEKSWPGGAGVKLARRAGWVGEGLVCNLCTVLLFLIS
jgi:hypothetical protein